MPNLNGLELGAEITKIRPKIPVILTTGYSDKAVSDFSGYDYIVAVLRKPIGFGALGQTIAQALTR